MEEIYNKLLEELKAQKAFSDKAINEKEIGDVPSDSILVDEDGVIIDD